MAMPTPQQATNNWASGMSSSTEKMKAGINAVTESPTAAAARNSDRYLQGIQRAVSSGKWQAGLNAVSLQDWKTSMIEKGVPRVASGAAAAKPKMLAFLQQFLPYVQAGVQQINSSNPRGDLEANIQRSAAMARYNAAFRKS